MVKNPVANLEDSELPCLTEHVPISPDTKSPTAAEVYEDCEIFLPKRQKKKVAPPPDRPLTELSTERGPKKSLEVEVAALPQSPYRPENFAATVSMYQERDRQHKEQIRRL